MQSPSTVIREVTDHNEDGSMTVTTTEETTYPDGSKKIVKRTRDVAPPSPVEIPPVTDPSPVPSEPTRSTVQTKTQFSNSINTEANDDTFSVPVEWPRGQTPESGAASTGAFDPEKGIGLGGGEARGGISSPSENEKGNDDDDSSDGEESFKDEKSSSSPKTVKWKLGLLFLSSIYEIISVITKSQLFLAIYELESCFRCDYDNEDLITALFIPSLMFFIFMILKEAGKVSAAFLNICCECELFCGDETVWPRNMFTIPIYVMKPTVIVPRYQDDYEYEYSQFHTLLNLCVEDLPFLIFGIYGVQQLNIKAGFGVFISFIGVLCGVVEAIRHVRKS